MIASVTGATGFIGSHIVDRLLEKGIRVRVLVRRTSDLRWLNGKHVERIEGDIRNPESLEDFIREADYVYHVAGVVKARNREEYDEGNVVATRNMLEAARMFAPNIRRFLYVSSLTVTGPSPSLLEPVNEESPCKPITTYGESKLAAEACVREYTHLLPWTIVRPPAVYGPRDTEIFIYFQTVARGINSMIGFDDKRVSLVHCDDLVRGILLAAETESARHGVFFISSEECYSWPQVGAVTSGVMGKRSMNLRIPHAAVYAIAAVAQGLASLQGKAATLNIEKARDITRPYWICDTSKAVRELGYRQEVSLKQGIRETVDWYRAQGWL